MKKTVKIFSLLLIVTLICAMIPTIMAAGQPEVTLDNSKLGDAVLEMGTPSSYTDLYDLDAGSITKARNAVANYQRLPRNTLVGIGTVTPVNYMIPVEGSVEVSNPDIIGECSFSLNGWNGGGFTTVPPCLQFNYKTLHTGTTTVKLTYFYNYGLVNVSGGTRWYKETATFTVNVTEDEVRAPEKPTETDAERFRNYVNSTSSSKGAVYMWCAENLYDHGAWFDYLTDVEGGYSFGEVVANDGSIKAAPANQYPWMCEMTVYADAYLNAYNEALAADCGTHYLCEGEPETQTFKWFHNGTRWFFVSSNAPVYINITHTAPVKEYTVTYTDGVEGEEIFENQSYTVKEGEATPAFNGSPEREGYVFLGWTPEVAQTVTEDVTYTAQWEEKLTGVTVRTSVKNGTLLFLHDTFTVTATANTSADIQLVLTDNKGAAVPAFRLTDTSVSEDGKTTTFRYEVVKISGAYYQLKLTATATKGTQEPVKATQSLGLNLRNRIHVTLKYHDGTLVEDAAVKLVHKYPQWNSSPKLKYDAAAQEYVMASKWDLSNQIFTTLSITLDGEEYTVMQDKFGRPLEQVIPAGTEEIYVEYVVIKPIHVSIYVNGELSAQEKYRGAADEILDYAQFQSTVITDLLTQGKTLVSLSTEGLNESNQAVFGETTEVVIRITTN